MATFSPIELATAMCTEKMMDTHEYKELSSAYTAYGIAENKLERAKKNHKWDVYHKWHNRDNTDKSNEVTKAELDSAKAELDSARANIVIAKTNYNIVHAVIFNECHKLYGLN